MLNLKYLVVAIIQILSLYGWPNAIMLLKLAFMYTVSRNKIELWKSVQNNTTLLQFRLASLPHLPCQKQQQYKTMKINLSRMMKKSQLNFIKPITCACVCVHEHQGAFFVQPHLPHWYYFGFIPHYVLFLLLWIICSFPHWKDSTTRLDGDLLLYSFPTTKGSCLDGMDAITN